MLGESYPPTPPNMDAIHLHRKQWGILSCFRKISCMSWKKHETRSFRKLITIREWMDYTGMTKPTVLRELEEYKKDDEYDSRDIFSTFDFLLHLVITKSSLKINPNKISKFTFLVSMLSGILKERPQSQPSTKSESSA
jgi:hypothetical protein